MSNYRQDPTLFFMMVAVLLLTLVLVVLGLIGFTVMRSGQQSPEPGTEQVFTVASTSEPVATQVPAPTIAATAVPAVEPTAVPTAEPTATSVPPTATPEPTPSPDLVLGTANRALDCQLMTDVVMTVLADEMDLMVEQRAYDSADTLFESLANQEIDITLCFVDPDDRGQIAGEDGERLGFIRQIGSHYWDSGDGKLQIWANGSSKATVRELHPCALQFLESIGLPDGALEISDSAEWLSENQVEVRSWIDCN